MDVRLFTDDKAKLIRQLESNRGDKTSALEAIGELAVERILSGKDGSRDAAIGEDASQPSLADLERKLDLGSTPGVAAEEMNEKYASKGADTNIANPRGVNGAVRPQAPAPRDDTQPSRTKGQECWSEKTTTP